MNIKQGHIWDRSLIEKLMNKIIDLGMHPFADTFISEDQLILPEPVYPLQCFLNKNTGEIRVGVHTRAHERYNLYDYSYTSSNSEFARNHWTNYAKEVSKKINLPNGSKVIEIGSNDGFLAKQFKDIGHKVLGVDASSEMANLALELGIKTRIMLFGTDASKTIKKDFGCADLIVANNVFNHSDDPEDFGNGVVNLLNKNGTFVYELPYWYNTIKDKKFDQIYHEHVTYFTVKFSYELLRKVGLEIVDVEFVDYHGGSLRVFAKKVDEVVLQGHIREIIEEEEKYGLFNQATYKYFMTALYDRKNKFMEKIYRIKLDGHSIIGVGAAAKGNTFLNFYNLDNTILDYITDSSKYKQGKYTPLTRIPIVCDEIFAKYDKVYALILSWNITDILKENLKKINDKIEFLSLPT